MSFLSVLSRVIFGGGSDILMISDSGKSSIVLLFSVLVHSYWLTFQASDPQELGSSSLGV